MSNKTIATVVAMAWAEFLLAALVLPVVALWALLVKHEEVGTPCQEYRGLYRGYWTSYRDTFLNSELPVRETQKLLKFVPNPNK